MQVSVNGLRLIEQHEGLRLTSYRDCAGILTVGYGHTGRDVHPNMLISQAQAETLLHADTAAAVAAVNRVVRITLTQNQFDALVSFTFNLGANALLTSTLLRKLNDGDVDAAADEFARWNKAGGVVEPGLVQRRAAEAALFRDGATVVHGISASAAGDLSLRDFLERTIAEDFENGGPISHLLDARYGG